jgi:hypothetical protein
VQAVITTTQLLNNFQEAENFVALSVPNQRIIGAVEVKEAVEMYLTMDEEETHGGFRGRAARGRVYSPHGFQLYPLPPEF